MIASAFTVIPPENEIHLATSCSTCTFTNGVPSGCTGAQFCGMTSCSGGCDMGGTICGECSGGDDQK